MTLGRGLLYVVSAAGLALLARSLLFGALPLWISILAFLAYLAIVVTGVVVPQLGMFADVLCRGPSGVAEIALTFDDGPHPEHTRKVLELLDAADVRATFFLLGSKVEACPSVARAIAERGHEIGVHGHEHDRWLSLRSPGRITKDLEKALTVIESVTGVRPSLFRPPVGHVSPRTETAASKLGLTLVGWSARGFDGLAGADAHQVAARIRRHLKPGAIVMLHDAAERGDREPAGVGALPAVLDAIHAQGLRVVPVSVLAAGRFGTQD
jgi:peptidoglycan/xylan/chitin deacetylase (PgdA/CDA1 family)